MIVAATPPDAHELLLAALVVDLHIDQTEVLTAQGVPLTLEVVPVRTDPEVVRIVARAPDAGEGILRLDATRFTEKQSGAQQHDHDSGGSSHEVLLIRPFNDSPKGTFHLAGPGVRRREESWTRRMAMREGLTIRLPPQLVQILHERQHRAVEALHVRCCGVDHVVLVRCMRAAAVAEAEMAGGEPERLVGENVARV